MFQYSRLIEPIRDATLANMVVCAIASYRALIYHLTSNKIKDMIDDNNYFISRRTHQSIYFSFLYIFF